MITKTGSRVRTQAKIFIGSASAIQAEYNAWEIIQAAVTTQTRQCRVVNIFPSGTDYVLLGEMSYPELVPPPATLPEPSI